MTLTVKKQQILNESAEYGNYDWEIFSTLTVEEKTAEFLKLQEMLLMRKRFKHFYFKQVERLANEEKGRKTRIRINNKILQLGKLIDILEEVVSQMELQIILLEQEVVVL